MNDYIDIYCERLSPGLLAEPLNAITNLSFIIAAIAAYLYAKKSNQTSWQSLSLIALLFIIGIGSALFHTFATFWAMLSDTLPILFYQIAFILLYSRFIMNKSPLVTALIFLAFIATIFGFAQLPSQWLNGSLQYAPAFIFLCALGLWHAFNIEKEKFTLIAAAFIFLISLSFRSIDMQICPQIPIGTHFLWHCFNGLLLYLTTRSYITASIITKHNKSS